MSSPPFPRFFRPFRRGVNRQKRRFVHKDGSPNVFRRGEAIVTSFNIYHFLLRMPMWAFALLILAFYTSINFIFATIYYLFCLDKLAGVIYGTPMENFEEAFFFSSQTLTTVGYGRISPVGLTADLIASLEAFIGILTLALITGTLYGKFVRPRAYIRFSHHAVCGPLNGIRALSFRIISSKRTSITDLQVRVSLSVLRPDGKGFVFAPLTLQTDQLNALYLSWTVSHIIDVNSPLFGMGEAEFEAARVELLVHLTGYDEHFNSTIVARTSYIHDEIAHDAVFVPMFHDFDTHTELYVNRLDQFEKVPAFSET